MRVGLTYEEALEAHNLINPEKPETRIGAINAVCQMIGYAQSVQNVADATLALRFILKAILEQNSYGIGAVLCWGNTLFDPRPHSVRVMWRALHAQPRLLIFGAGSMGKSYTVIVFKRLDWERDPENTTVKLVSTTAGHNRANTFSNLVRLHNESHIPLSGYVRQGFIGLDKDDKRSSIAEVSIDKGDENKSGKLQGFHPLPRKKRHPTFGWLTRVSGVFDEVEDIAVGVWKGESNMMQNLDDKMHVSICAMWNPKLRGSIASQKAAPVGGWVALDERLDEYKSDKGYHVVRVDARRCENVMNKTVQRTDNGWAVVGEDGRIIAIYNTKEEAAPFTGRAMIFHGLQTWEGFKEKEDGSPEDRDTFAYGIYPTVTATYGIINAGVLEQCRGRFIWGPRRPYNLMTLDWAEEGEDEAISTVAQYGAAIGFQPAGARKPTMFPKPRWVIQIEQQFPLIKQANVILMGRDFIKIARDMAVTGEWTGLDVTNTVALWHWLKLKWADGVVGIKWNESPTEMPLLEESGEKAIDLFSNVKTEMWFATGDWAQFGYLAFSPNMDTALLFEELAGMRYRWLNKKKICDTKEYKKNSGGKSPDHASSVIMAPQLVRLKSAQMKEGQGQGQTGRPAIDPNAPARSNIFEGGDYQGGIDSRESSEVIDAIDYIYD